jgi:type 1 glutamine amidotransferase
VLGEFDAVMFNNTTQLKFENEKWRSALMDFVKSGKGICGIHAATDNFPRWPEAAAMMGGLFAGHPWGGGGTWAVQIEGPDHPVNQGFAGKGFWIKDEIYKMRDPYSRENLRILVGLDMTKKENKPGRPDNDNAISWIREFESGKVFYCSLGHNNHIFWTPDVLKHYLDGIQYAMGDLEADATPSAKLGQKPTIVPAPDKA